MKNIKISNYRASTTILPDNKKFKTKIEEENINLWILTPELLSLSQDREDEGDSMLSDIV